MLLFVYQSRLCVLSFLVFPIVTEIYIIDILTASRT